MTAITEGLGHLEWWDVDPENTRNYLHVGCDVQQFVVRGPLDDVPPPLEGALSECACCGVIVPLRKRSRRLEDREELGLEDLTPGDYAMRCGAWWLMTPNGALGRLAMPFDVEAGRASDAHYCVVEKDGTLSTPFPRPDGQANSIKIIGYAEQGGQMVEWHGYLRAGKWDEC